MRVGWLTKSYCRPGARQAVPAIKAHEEGKSLLAEEIKKLVVELSDQADVVDRFRGALLGRVTGRIDGVGSAGQAADAGRRWARSRRISRSSRSTSAVARHSAASRSATAARLLASARSAWCVSLPALQPLPLRTTAHESIRCSAASVRSRRSAAITVSAISAALRRRMRWPSASWQQGWRRHGLRVVKSPAHRGAATALRLSHQIGRFRGV